jgi:hypothetical protein
MVRDGIISWVQHKGRNSENPIEVTIPMLPELRIIIEATPVVGTTTFLVKWWANSHGEPIGSRPTHQARCLRLPPGMIARPIDPGSAIAPRRSKILKDPKVGRIEEIAMAERLEQGVSMEAHAARIARSMMCESAKTMRHE